MNKNTKIIVGIIIAVIVIWIGYLIYQKQFQPTSKETIKIGAILPLTGNNTEWGEKPKNGIDFALWEVNKDEKFIEVIYEDSEGKSAKGTSAAQKLINTDKVQVLFCQLSDVCSAIAPIAQENKVVLFGFTNTPDFTKVGEFIFNARGESIDPGIKLGNFAASKYKKAAVLYLNNATQKGVAEGFKQEFENNGGKVVFMESHTNEQLDFRTSLLKAKEVQPDMLFFGSRVANTVSLVKQAKELNLTQPIICSLGIDTKGFLDGLGNLAEGIIYPGNAISVENLDKDLKAKVQLYQETHNEQMPFWSAESYDIVKLLGFIVKNTKETLTADKIKDKVTSLKDFSGLTGMLDFSNERTVKKEYYLFTIKNGQFVPYGE